MEPALFLRVWTCRPLLREIKRWHDVRSFGYSARRAMKAGRRDLAAYVRIGPRTAYYGLKYRCPELFWRAYPYLWTDLESLYRYPFRCGVPVVKELQRLCPNRIFWKVSPREVISDAETLAYILPLIPEREVDLDSDSDSDDPPRLRMEPVWRPSVTVHDPQVRILVLENPICEVRIDDRTTDEMLLDCGWTTIDIALRRTNFSIGDTKYVDPSPEVAEQMLTLDPNKLPHQNQLHRLYKAGRMDLLSWLRRRHVLRQRYGRLRLTAKGHLHKRDLLRYTAEGRTLLVKYWLQQEIKSLIPFSSTVTKLMQEAGWVQPLIKWHLTEYIIPCSHGPRLVSVDLERDNLVWRTIARSFRSHPHCYAYHLVSLPAIPPLHQEWLRRYCKYLQASGRQRELADVQRRWKKL